MRFVQPIKAKEQLQDFKEYLKVKNKRDYILFLLGVNLGLRISDILLLKVKDVKNTLSVKVFEEKTGKFNQIIIYRELRKTLETYIKGCSKGSWLHRRYRNTKHSVIVFIRSPAKM